jgi:predicted SAM-dependent methyltransferase
LSWAWRCGDGEAESANWSKSLRIDVDCRKAELKSAFCLQCELIRLCLPFWNAP